MAGLSIDAGGLIAFQRGSQLAKRLIREALEAGEPIHVIPEVVAQVWREGPRNVPIARFLNRPDVEVPPYTQATARRVGELSARVGVPDVVDVHVVAHARLHGHRILTSDPDDLRRIDPRIPLIVV